MSVKCSECQREIGREDFNVAKDIAYCSYCDENFCYSDLVEDSEYDDVDLTELPRGLRIRNGMRGEELVYKKISFVVLFLIPFTAVWSGISMTAIVMTIKDKGFTFEALFFLPFLLVSIVLVSIIIFCFCGKMEIKNDRDIVEIFTGALGIGRKKMFHVNDLKRAFITEASYRQNNQTVYLVELDIEGSKNIRFASFVKTEVKEYLVAYFNKKFRR